MTELRHDAISHTRLDAVTDFLMAHGVAHEVIEHRATYRAIAEAAATDTPPREAAKTVVLHDGGVYSLAVVPASHRVDLHKVRELLGVSKTLRLADEDEIAADFPQFEVGAVPPVGEMPAAELIDRRLMDAESVLISGGDHRHSVRLDPRDLVRVTDARVSDICAD